jgi:hypothetical protein
MRPIALIVLGVSSLSFVAKAQDKVTFVDHMKPLFQSRCFNCHNPDKKKGGLDLTSFGAITQGGSGGAVASSGDHASSRLWTTTAKKEEPFMPPEGDPLKSDELALIAKWIDGGMLETASSIARKPEKPKLEIVASAAGRPEGPPPMPEHTLLEPVITAPRPDTVFALAASPWAPLIAVNGQKQVVLYNSNSGFVSAFFPYPEGAVKSVRFSRNGSLMIVGGGHPAKSGSATIFDVKTGRRVATVGDEVDTVLSADIRSDHSLIAFGTPGKKVKAYDTAGTLIYEIKKHSEWVTAVSFSNDGILLATGDRNGGLSVWEADGGGEYLNLEGNQGAVTDLSWSPDSNILASSSEDGNVRLWEMNEGKEVKKWAPHTSGVLSLSFSHEGNIVTSGRDRRVKVWKADGTLLKDLGELPDLPTRVVFLEDGKHVVAGDWTGQMVKWNIDSGEKIITLNQNPAPIDQRVAATQQLVAELTTALATAEGERKAVEAELANKQKALDDTKGVLVSLQQRQANLPAEMADAEKRLGEARAAVTQATQARDKNKTDFQAMETVKAQLVAAEGKIAEIKAAIAPINEQLQKARTPVPPAPDQPAPAVDQNLVNTLEAQLAQRTAEEQKATAERDRINSLMPNPAPQPMEAMEAKLTEIQTKVTAIEAEKKAKQDELAQLPAKLQEKQAAIEPMTKALEDYKNQQLGPKVAAHEALSHRINLANKEIALLHAGKFNVGVLAEKETLLKLESEKSNHEGILQGAEEIVKGNTQKIAEANTLVAKIDAEMPAMEATVVRLQQEYTAVEALLAPMKQQMVDMTAKMEALKLRKPVREKEIADAKAKWEEAKAAKPPTPSPVPTDDPGLPELTQTREQLAKMEKQMADSLAETTRLRGEWVAKAEASLMADTQNAAETEKALAELTKKVTETEALFAAKKVEMDQSVAARDQAKAQRQASAEAMPKLQEQIQSVTAEAEKSKVALPSVMQALDSQKKKVDELHQQYLGMLPQ